MKIKLNMLLVIILSASAALKSQWTQIGQDIDGGVGEYSGYSVSISSDGSIVALGATMSGVEAGKVRIFENISNSWVQIGADIAGEAWYDHSGYSVSLSSDGSIVAIGAPDNTVNGSHTGHVRIFENISGNWVQLGEDIDGEDAQNYCGKSVSLSADGSVVAVGAMGNNNNGWFSGQVSIFENVSGSWEKIGNDIQGVEYSDFGAAVSLNSDGSVVAVGAPGGGTGSVSVFEYTYGTWTQAGESIYSNLGSPIGRSISLSSDGKVLAVGSPRSEEMGATAGRVRIYKNTDGSWVQMGEDLYGEVYDHFGYSIDLNNDGSKVAIGAAQIDHWLETWGGYVRILEYSTGSWVQVHEDINGEAIGDNFGWSVSMSSDGNTVAIGAPENDGSAPASGHVRVYGNPYHGIHDFEENNLSIYPNPVKNELNISLEGYIVDEAAVYTLTGQQVLIIRPQNSSIDISTLTPGIYILEVTAGRRKIMQKLLVE